MVPFAQPAKGQQYVSVVLLFVVYFGPSRMFMKFEYGPHSYSRQKLPPFLMQSVQVMAGVMGVLPIVRADAN